MTAVLILNTPDDGHLTPETCRVTAEIKPAQCCINLVFHLTYTVMHGSTKLKPAYIVVYHHNDRNRCYKSPLLHVRPIFITFIGLDLVSDVRTQAAIRRILANHVVFCLPVLYLLTQTDCTQYWNAFTSRFLLPLMLMVPGVTYDWYPDTKHPASQVRSQSLFQNTARNYTD